MPHYKKRHVKGSTHGADKRQRREHAEEWKKGGHPDPADRPATGTDDRIGTGNLPSGGAYELNDATLVVNKSFESFYKCLNNIRHEKPTATEEGQQKELEQTEFEQFIETLHRPLPACFRINPGFAFSRTLVEQLQVMQAKIEATPEFHGKNLIQPLNWFPFQGFAYKLTADRKTIRKDPNLTELHEWLKLHTNNGNLTRQEAVSMVPPIALNISPHHRVLDMCAAPGSKTTQLLEIVTNGSNGNKEGISIHQGSTREPGLVVANDSSTDRAYLLVHQCRRLCSPHLMVTTHMAQQFPTTVRHVHRNEANASATSTNSGDATSVVAEPVLFDRVLADVPCSGDGTMRKNPAIWTSWNVSGSHALHPLQLQIAQRGLQLLAPGGQLVYSTCSMSPYEDEAAVAELLRSNIYPSTAGADRAGKPIYEVIDGREHLPGFKARPGLTTWHVFDDVKKLAYIPRERGNKSGRYVEEKEKKQTVGESKKEGDADAPASESVTEPTAAAESVTAPFDHPDPLVRACVTEGDLVYYANYAAVGVEARRKIRPTVFPPTPEEVQWMGLEKCMRCVPHDEDSGGFFVATLRRIRYPGDDDKDKEEKEEGAVNGEEKEEKEKPVATTDVAPAGDELATITATATTTTTQPAATTSKPQQQQQNQQSVSFRHYDGARFQKLCDFYGFITPDQHAHAQAQQAQTPEQQQQQVVHQDGFTTSLSFSSSRLITENSFYYREDGNSGHYNSGSAHYGKRKNKDKDADASAASAESDALKSIYFCPYQLRKFMEIECASSSSGNTASAEDKARPGRLKIVTTGIKAFERQKTNSLGKIADEGEGGCDYRVMQECIPYLAPYMTKRKVKVTVGDICNMLEGGLVSYHTLSESTVHNIQHEIKACGSVVCVYEFDPKDVLSTADTASAAEYARAGAVSTGAGGIAAGLTHYIVAWKGKARTLNVMASKVDLDAIRLQLENLGVYRPKISRSDHDAALAAAAAAAATVTVGEVEVGVATSTPVTAAAVTTNASECSTIDTDANTDAGAGASAGAAMDTDTA